MSLLKLFQKISQEIHFEEMNLQGMNGIIDGCFHYVKKICTDTIFNVFIVHIRGDDRWKDVDKDLKLKLEDFVIFRHDFIVEYPEGGLIF